MSTTHLFTVLNTLGVVCADGSSPSQLYQVGNNYRIVCSTGRGVIIYNAHNLQPITRSPPLAGNVTAIAAHMEDTYVALSSGTVAHLRRLNERRILKPKRSYGKSPIRGLLALGWALLGWTATQVFVWDLETGKVRRLPIVLPDHNSEIAIVIHPEGLLNKVIIAFKNGPADVRLWNIRSRKQVYAFSSTITEDSSGATALCTTLHPDAIAISFESGVIRLFDIRQDKVLAEVSQNITDHGAVTSLSCLTCTTCSKPGLLLSGTASGEILVWDLEETTLLSSIHVNEDSLPVRSIQCLPGDLTFIVTGSDNSILSYVFDDAKRQKPRLLRERRGLPYPAAFLQNYNEMGGALLTVGTGQPLEGIQSSNVAFVSTSLFGRNWRFSQQRSLKSLNVEWKAKRRVLPPILSIAFAPSRHFDWGNIVTCHKGLPYILIWSGHDRRLLPRAHRPGEGHKFKPTAVAVSGCGSYVVAGCEDGSLWKFNLQSGICRGEFKGPNEDKAHRGPITCIEIRDSSCVLSSSPLDRGIKTWDLHCNRYIKTSFGLEEFSNYNIKSFVTYGVMTAVVLSNCPPSLEGCGVPPIEKRDDREEKIVLVDVALSAVLRRFPAVQGEILSTTFTRDSRWLSFSTREDRDLQVYDILSGVRIDWIKFDGPVLSQCWDINNTFLYIGVDGPRAGITVLCNRHIFVFGVGANVFDECKKPVSLYHKPHRQVENEADMGPLRGALIKIGLEHTATSKVDNYQLAPHEMTLCGLSGGYLEAITHLDLIKERNTRKVESDKDVVAPFFIPTAYSASGSLELLKENAVAEEPQKSQAAVSLFDRVEGKPYIDTNELQRLLNKRPKQENSTITRKKRTDYSTEDALFRWAEDIVAYLMQLSPSAINLAIAELHDAKEELELMTDWFRTLVLNRRYVDFVQAVLSVFIQLHNETLETMVTENENFGRKLKSLRDAISGDWNVVSSEIDRMLCFLKYLTNTQLETAA